MQPAMRIFTPEKPLQSWDTTQNPAGKQTFGRNCGQAAVFPVVPHEVAVNDHVQVINERPIAILGQTHAEGVQTEQNTYAVDGVFVLRDAVAPDKLVQGLPWRAHVRVDANMATNLSAALPAAIWRGSRTSTSRRRGRAMLQLCRLWNGWQNKRSKRVLCGT